MGYVRPCALAVAMALAVVLSNAGAAADENASARITALAPHFHTYRPDGPGPFPGLMFVSGCLGFAPANAPQAYTSLAETWKAKGYVIVFVDYLAAKGMQQCDGTVTPEGVGKDVIAVADYLRGQTYIDKSRISAFGWSLGGAAVLSAIEEPDADKSSPLRSVVAYTPICSALSPWSKRVPALVLLGADDPLANPALCKDLIAQLPPGTPVDAKIYPHAGHVFDLPGAPGYDQAASAAAADEVDRFMSR